MVLADCQYRRLGRVPAGCVIACIVDHLDSVQNDRCDFAARRSALSRFDLLADQNEMGDVVPTSDVAPLYYLSARTNLWSGQSAVELAQMTVGEARADIARFPSGKRGPADRQGIARPIFGWGGWGRNRVYDEMGNDMAVTDGYWIIFFGSPWIRRPDYR